MEKIKLSTLRKSKGYSTKDVADYLSMEEYSYRRREKGETRISNKEWKKLADFFQVEYDDIFEPESYPVNINNGGGQINNFTDKIEYYNIPKEVIEMQQEYIDLLKKEISTLTSENQSLKEQLKK